VQLAEQHTSNMVVVDCQIVDLFDIPKSQGSDDQDVESKQKQLNDY
jgi:hypothetical protein